MGKEQFRNTKAIYNEHVHNTMYLHIKIKVYKLHTWEQYLHEGTEKKEKYLKSK